jgi:hypothetical protein
LKCCSNKQNNLTKWLEYNLDKKYFCKKNLQCCDFNLQTLEVLRMHSIDDILEVRKNKTVSVNRIMKILWNVFAAMTQKRVDKASKH